jgi:hypothetical protein
MLSKLDARLKQAAPATKKHLPFGGMHIVFCGDFIQYPCVGGTNLYDTMGPKPVVATVPDEEHEDTDQPDESEAHEYDPTEDINAHSTGRGLWMLVNYAIFLTEQMRQNDPVYLAMLTELRQRSLDNIEDHKTLLSTRTLGSDTADASATCAEFDDAPVITTRNAVRVAINFQKAKVKAASQGVKLVVCLARDSLAKKHGDMSLDLRKALLHEQDHKTNGMSGMLSLVPGMPLIVKKNIATELGICNGTRCTFSRLVLHPQEPIFDLASGPALPREHFLRKAPMI